MTVRTHESKGLTKTVRDSDPWALLLRNEIIILLQVGMSQDWESAESREVTLKYILITYQ